MIEVGISTLGADERSEEGRRFGGRGCGEPWQGADLQAGSFLGRLVFGFFLEVFFGCAF